MNAPDSGVLVSYPLKELLERMDGKLESIDHKLDAKADIREVADLRSRIDSLERREEQRIAILKDRGEVFSRREKIIGLALIALGLVIQLYVSRYYVHHP